MLDVLKEGKMVENVDIMEDTYALLHVNSRFITLTILEKVGIYLIKQYHQSFCILMTPIKK